MKAALFHEHGGPEVLRYEDVDEPEAGPNNVLIRVRACGMNHLDIHVRRGMENLTIPLPHIGGSDIAGTIEEIGNSVEGLDKGQRVVVNPGLWCGWCEFCLKGEECMCIKYRIIGEHTQGGFAELVTVPWVNIIPIPDDFPFEKAAAVPLVFQTAWRMVVTRAQVRPGETVMILGASGGVGSAAVQIAKLSGARVIAVSGSEEKLKKLMELGADKGINYKTEEIRARARELTRKRGVDVVIENVGTATFEQSIRSLAKNGRLVTCGATTGPRPEIDLRYIFWNQLNIMGSTMGSQREVMAALDQVWTGRLKPVIDRVWPLSRLREGHEVMESGDLFGKLVFTP